MIVVLIVKVCISYFHLLDVKTRLAYQWERISDIPIP